jgi:phage gp46-like protein
MATGDYVMKADNSPSVSTSLAAPTRCRLRCHRKGWLYAPNTNFGSDFFKYLRRKSVVFSDALAENIATKALQPVVDDGRADNLDVLTQKTQRGGVALGITLTDTQQNQPVAVTVPVGG